MIKLEFRKCIIGLVEVSGTGKIIKEVVSNNKK